MLGFIHQKKNTSAKWERGLVFAWVLQRGEYGRRGQRHPPERVLSEAATPRMCFDNVGGHLGMDQPKLPGVILDCAAGASHWCQPPLGALQAVFPSLPLTFLEVKILSCYKWDNWGEPATSNLHASLYLITGISLLSLKAWDDNMTNIHVKPIGRKGSSYFWMSGFGF